MWECNMDDHTDYWYNMIIDRDLLKILEIDLRFSDNTIACSDGPY